MLGHACQSLLNTVVCLILDQGGLARLNSRKANWFLWPAVGISTEIQLACVWIHLMNSKIPNTLSGRWGGKHSKWKVDKRIFWLLVKNNIFLNWQVGGVGGLFGFVFCFVGFFDGSNGYSKSQKDKILKAKNIIIPSVFMLWKWRLATCTPVLPLHFFFGVDKMWSREERKTGKVWTMIPSNFKVIFLRISIFVLFKKNKKHQKSQPKK